VSVNFQLGFFPKENICSLYSLSFEAKQIQIEYSNMTEYVSNMYYELCDSDLEKILKQRSQQALAKTVKELIYPILKAFGYLGA
jgi:hypothetical protein